MRRALILATLLALPACGPTRFELPLDLGPDERLLVVILNAISQPVQALLVGPESEGIETELDEGWSLVRGAFARSDFVTEDGAPVSNEMLSGLALSAEPSARSIRSPLGCSPGWSQETQLVHPGDLCPLPPSIALEREQSTPDGMKAEALADAERAAIRAGVRLGWPGSLPCNAGLESNQPPPRAQLLLEIESPRPKRPSGYRATSHTAGGRVALGNANKLALASLAGESRTTTTTHGIAAVLGLDGEQFLVATLSQPAGQVVLQLFDASLRPTAELALAGGEVHYARLQGFAGDNRIVLFTQARNMAVELYSCRVQPVAPRISCGSVLRLERPFQTVIEDSSMLFADGTFMLASSTLDLLSLERLPVAGELLAPSVSSASSGTIATATGPIAWRLDPVRVEHPGGSTLSIEAVDGAIRTTAFGAQAVACVARGSSDESWIATASISAGFIARGEAPPPFRIALGPYEPHCRPAPVAPASGTLRVNFTFGQALDLDARMQTIACFGPICDQPGDPPSKPPLSSSFRVLSNVPGWSLAMTESSSQILLRRDSEGPSFQLVYDGRDTWFGALATRGRAFWAFHTGRGRVDAGALAGIDPPIVAPHVCVDDEIPLEAALDSVRDSFVVVGTSRDLSGAFVRRVGIDETVSAVPIPPALADGGWPVSLAQFAPGRFLIATSRGHLWLLDGDVLRDLPIRDWDDHTTPATETMPVTCTKSGFSFAPDDPPLFRSVRAVQGVVIVAGCRALTLRVWVHGDEAEIDVVDPTVDALKRDDASEVAGVCLNQLYSASDGGVLRGQAPYERSELDEGFGHGYQLTLADQAEGQITNLLASPDRLLILRAESMVSTIRALGSAAETAFPSRFVNATQSSDGVLLISTSDDQLLLAR